MEQNEKPLTAFEAMLLNPERIRAAKETERIFREAIERMAVACDYMNCAALSVNHKQAIEKFLYMPIVLTKEPSTTKD